MKFNCIGGHEGGVFGKGLSRQKHVVRTDGGSHLLQMQSQPSVMLIYGRLERQHVHCCENGLDLGGQPWRLPLGGSKAQLAGNDDGCADGLLAMLMDVLGNNTSGMTDEI